ncbi:NAD(P)-binding domain-containing protein [Actinotalea sp.]|uniref:NAD(P)-binding domain-containing protein n=1 Tax=Actinotalea sp. TaxID=1872145 RepID=UPI003566FAAC
MITTSRTDLPVAVIGAGPIGLAAAAHLSDRGLPFVVLEAGDDVGAAVSEWAHVRTFTPWQYLVDPTAEALLAATGWTRPATPVPPTGGELVDEYLRPLGALLAPHVRLGHRVTAVTRDGLDKTRSIGRSEHPFLLRVQGPDGELLELRARAVLDASGTWAGRNPLGASGLPAAGEDAAAPFLVGPLPDVLGRDRERFAGRSTLVVGSGHSAANTLLALGRLAAEEPTTRIIWAIRGDSPEKVYGGGSADQLEARGRLGEDLRSLVASGVVRLVPRFSVTGLESHGDTVSVIGATPEQRIDDLHQVAAATGFRPDLAMLSEVRLDLDPGLEAPRALGPLIDPAYHSCGTVPPHGHRDLAQPEEGFFIIGMKSYGRAPTFLVTTGNEQARSVVAALAGDLEGADRVQLLLPETGVCSVDATGTDLGAGSCCGTTTAARETAVPVTIGAVPAAAHRPLPVGVAAQGFATGAAPGGIAATAVRAPDSGCCG